MQVILHISIKKAYNAKVMKKIERNHFSIYIFIFKG